MERCYRLIVAVLLVGSASGIAQAQRHGDRRAQPEWTAAADQMFGQWFGETDAERQALENVEVDRGEEQRVGDAARDGFLASLKQQHVRVLTRGRDVEYVRALVDEIRPQMRHAKRYRKIQVYVADSTETDARAFPGGSIVVMTGLINFAEGEAALVGVLGHELAHIDHGHQLRMARAAKLAQGGWDFRQGDPQAMQQRIMTMSRNFAKPFSADDEAAADRDGATWALALGYDPQELAELFCRFEQRSAGDPQRMPAFLRTHPNHAERYAAIKEFSDQARAAESKRVLYVGVENLRRRTPRSEQEFAE